MSHLQIPRRRKMFCGVLVILLISGCQFAYEYEVHGVVRNAADGQPIADVSVALDAGMLIKDAQPCVTNKDGSFVLTFTVSDGAFSPGAMPNWGLQLTKEDFIDQAIDISPVKEPQSAKSVNLISVIAYMRPNE